MSLVERAAKAAAQRANARAALAETRSPTPEMIAAGAKKVRGGSSRDCAAACWRAMHDEMMRRRKRNAHANNA